MSIESILRRALPGACLICAIAGGAVAATPQPALEAQAAQQAADPPRLLERLLGEQASPVRELDPAIFTELRPVTASEPPVQLPADQREDD